MGSPGSDNSGSASLSSSGSRKRSALSTNEGPNRSVVDFDTEDQLREALLSFLNEEDVSNQSCSTQLTSFISEIREGQLVQKVGLFRYHRTCQFLFSINVVLTLSVVISPLCSGGKNSGAAN